MSKVLRVVFKYLVLTCVFGCIYLGLEMLWRGHTHWTMFIVSAICCVSIGLLNEGLFQWEWSLLKQTLIGSLIILLIEFISGCIINLLLGWAVWDYSEVPFNLLGQVCLPYYLDWIPLAGVTVVCDDYLRWWLFNEEKPRYKII